MSSELRKSGASELLVKNLKRMSRLSRVSISSYLDQAQMMRFEKAFRRTKGGFQVPLYQNTYRLEPQNPYQQNVADKILKTVMDTTLKNVTYNASESSKLCNNMVKRVQNQLSKKNYDRYKIVVSIMIIQKTKGAVFMSLEHLWDAQKDRYSIYIFENYSLYAVGIISALYYE